MYQIIQILHLLKEIVMNKAAISHKIGRSDCYCLKDDIFVIRITTAKNDFTGINFIYRDKYIHNASNILKTLPMGKVASDELFDYYEVLYNNTYLATKYCFELIGEHETLYYSNYRFYNEFPDDDSILNTMPKRIYTEDMIHGIDFMQGKVVYQIFPDRFCRGDITNEGEAANAGETLREKSLSVNMANKSEFKKWGDNHITWKDKFGGNLEGIISKLDYLDDLGVDILYLTPIFKSPSNHKYDTEDYLVIDPDFGTNEDLKRLCDGCHERGIKVILDCVFDHCGGKFAPFLDLIEQGDNSRYKDWFYINKTPIEPDKHPQRSYDTFSYYGNMPKLNVSTPAVREYVYNMVHQWMDNYGVDGWRLDVADETAHSFWVYFKEVVKNIKADAPIIGEIWYDPSDWLRGDEFDSTMNYPFFYAVNEYLAKRCITPSDFLNALGHIRGTTNLNTYNMLWNLIDSHDSARFLHCAGENKAILKLAALLQFTISGTPVIYYGDEVGLTGGNDPDCRRCMVWDDDKQDKELLNYYKTLIKLRRQYTCLRTGTLKEVLCDDICNVLAYMKSDDKDSLVIIINNSDSEYDIKDILKKYTADHCCVLDLITGSIFSGVVPACSGVIVKC